MKSTSFSRLRTLFRGSSLRDILRNWRWILSFTRGRRLRILALTLFGLLSSVLSLGAGLIVKGLIDSIIAMDLDRLLPSTVLMILCGILSVAFQCVSARFSARLSVTMSQEVQKHTFDHVLGAEWMHIRQFPTGDLLNRLSGDVSTVANCAMGFVPNVIVHLFTLLVTFFVILYFDPVLAVICVISTPVLFLASKTLLRRQHAFSRQLRQVSSEVSAFQSEAFRNLDTLKGFGIEPLVSVQHNIHLNNSRDVILKQNSFSIRTHALLSLLSSLVQYSAMAYCIWQLWQGNMILSTMTFFLQQRGTLQSAFSGLVNQVPQILSGSVAAERLRELTELPQDPADAGLIPPDQCGIRLENVCAAYEDGIRVLDGVSLTAGPGEIIALVGPSGEGKTTLLRLLLGLMKPQSGSLTVTDGSGNSSPLDARTRHWFSYVPQGNTLLAGTIAENLRLVRPNASDAELIDALKRACAWEFVSAMPDTIHTRLGEGGLGLSEGQAQRIAIARALMRRAPAMILDEITSALDLETERRVLEQLMNLGVTCIVSTHRPSVLTMCTRAYRIEDKKLTQLSSNEIQSLTSAM